MSADNSVILVAVEQGKVVGLVKADLKDRVFYEPRKEGAIVEFYILPEFRRGNLGSELLSEVSESLKKKGAELLLPSFQARMRLQRISIADLDSDP